MFIITEEDFKELFGKILENDYEHALDVFKKYGRNFSWDVANVIMHASCNNKIEDVLQILEEHYEKHIYFQHPDRRAAFEDFPTRLMFNRVCTEILQLTPSAC